MCYVLMYLPQYIPNLSSTFSISYTQEETNEPLIDFKKL